MHNTYIHLPRATLHIAYSTKALIRAKREGNALSQRSLVYILNISLILQGYDLHRKVFENGSHERNGHESLASSEDPIHALFSRSTVHILASPRLS